MNSNKEENFDKIKVFSSDDEKLKVLGELLSNKSSRDIIRLLIENEMYTNEIAKKLELRPNLVIHHLQKMESIGLLEITNKKIIKKGEEHRFFRIPKGMLIIPNESEKIKENGMLKKVFKKSVKFMVVGTVAFGYWFLENSNKGSLDSDSSKLESLIFPLLIVIIGLIVGRLLSKKLSKKIKRHN